MSETADGHQRAQAALDAYLAAHEDYGTDGLADVDAVVVDLVADLCHLVDRTGTADPGALLADAVCRFYRHELRAHLRHELNGSGDTAVEVDRTARRILAQLDAARADAIAGSPSDELIGDAEDLATQILGVIRS